MGGPGTAAGKWGEMRKWQCEVATMWDDNATGCEQQKNTSVGLCVGCKELGSCFLLILKMLVQANRPRVTST